MNEVSRLWVNAGIALSENAQIIVNCPECKVGILKSRMNQWKNLVRLIAIFIVIPVENGMCFQCQLLRNKIKAQPTTIS